MAIIYKERLDNIKLLVLLTAPGSDPDHFDIYKNYKIEANNRDELKNYFADNGVGVSYPVGRRC
jgi:hypothetical protein